MKTNEKLFDTYYSLLVSKVEQVNEDWSKPWITLKSFAPQNLRGTNYNAGNALFLLFFSEMKGFSLPVFMTFKQAQEENVIINKGEKSFPVTFYKAFIVHKETGKEIMPEEYNNLSDDEKNDYKRRFMLNYYNVFNIDQTNFKEVHPAKYQNYIDLAANVLPETNNFTSEPLDEMIYLNAWYCPIHIRQSNRAFYNPGNDFVVLPLKEQFPKCEQFYSTLLHEIAHSTGHENRLHRELKGKTDQDSYAKEELTAELTAAVAGSMLNIFVTPDENNAAYLKNWLSILKEEPNFLFTLFASVNKASKMILEKIKINVNECEVI